MKNNRIYNPSYSCGYMPYGKDFSCDNNQKCVKEFLPHQHDNCKTVCKQKKSLAMAYVPVQELGALYEPCKAICAGTAFPALDLVFCGRRYK